MLVEQAERAGPEPLRQLEALFTDLEVWAGHDEFRGCPYLNAAAERPDLGAASRAAGRAHKERLRSWIAERLQQAGVPDPTTTARQLLLVFDGHSPSASSPATDGPPPPPGSSPTSSSVPHTGDEHRCCERLQRAAPVGPTTTDALGAARAQPWARSANRL